LNSFQSKGHPILSNTTLATENTTIPAFLKATWKYLLGVSDADAWRGLLARFVEFELREAGIGVRTSNLVS
jgi:hypothetical protein